MVHMVDVEIRRVDQLLSKYSVGGFNRNQCCDMYVCRAVVFVVVWYLFVFYFFCVGALSCFFFFFFSSRRRHTRFDCDWSSDVCSSDLEPLPPGDGGVNGGGEHGLLHQRHPEGGSP